jgi:D-amino-acid oxidase
MERRTVDRRTVLKTGGMAILALGVASCRPKIAAVVTPRRPPLNLPLVNISWDRVIRTTVGLRPHRPSGFVLKAEKLDDRTLIHNYGHGGTGHSLGWGTGSLAADLAMAQSARRAAVIGCGTVGLTAARQLQRRGFDVTIYAMAVPPDTTSNMSLAAFTPTSGLISGEYTPEWEAQFRRAAEITYRQLQLLAGAGFGVSWVDGYSVTNVEPQAGRSVGGEGGALLPAELRGGREVLGPGEHPFPSKYAIRTPGIRIEPSIYLTALMRDVVLFGGRIVVRKFDTPRDLMSLAEPVIVNCTGLGAKDLFGDKELIPIKGQLTVLVPQPEINYRTSGGVPSSSEQNAAPGGFGIHMLPRSDGIILGGTQERGVSTLDPNDEARRRIVEGHIQLFTAMRPPVPGQPLATSEPPRTVPSLETFCDTE